MKRKVKIIVIVILLVSALFINTKAIAILPLSGKIIVLDAGHGGKDPGTLYNKTYEKDINLKITKYLETELTKVGANVILTRDGDYDLSTPNAKWRKKSDFDNRIKIINNSNAQLYLSIHLNYLENASYYGPQVFFIDQNKTLASTIQKKLNENLNTNREEKKIPSKTYMYDKLTIPGVLIECGFLSNANERTQLETSAYQKKIASLIKDAIIEYF